MEHNTNNNEQPSPGFSIYQFKKWLDENNNGLPTLDLNKPELDIDRTLGSPVYPKVSDTKIIERMEDNDTDKATLLAEFKINATVLKNYGKRVTILVESGTFSIPRFCVKIDKKK